MLHRRLLLVVRAEASVAPLSAVTSGPDGEDGWCAVAVIATSQYEQMLLSACTCD